MFHSRKEEYMSEAGLGVLFDRAGGKLTDKMADIITKMEVHAPHAERLLQEVWEIWEEWCLKKKQYRDIMVEYDPSFNGFMAHYNACYRYITRTSSVPSSLGLKRASPSTQDYYSHAQPMHRKIYVTAKIMWTRKRSL